MTLVETEDFVVDLEYNEYFAILHLPFVREFNRTVYLELQHKMSQLGTLFDTLGYEHIWAAVPEDNPLIRKFLTRLSFEEQGTANRMVVYKYLGET